MKYIEYIEGVNSQAARFSYFIIAWCSTVSFIKYYKFYMYGIVHEVPHIHSDTIIGMFVGYVIIGAYLKWHK